MQTVQFDTSNAYRQSVHDPGFVDIAMRVMESINAQCYNVSETSVSGISTFKIYLKDEFGNNGEMVAVVTYDPKRGTVFLQQARYPQPQPGVLPRPGVSRTLDMSHLGVAQLVDDMAA